MSVLTRSFKQTNGYFVPVGNCQGKVFNYSGSSGSGGDAKVGNFSTPTGWWAAPTLTAAQASAQVALVSTLLVGPTGATPGGLFKDMGKTVVSASRTFRKVQLVVPGLSTNGVAGSADTMFFLTGYIELAGAGGLAIGRNDAAPVAYLPGLM